jgi:hypothetical protein
MRGDRETERPRAHNSYIKPISHGGNLPVVPVTD